MKKLIKVTREFIDSGRVGSYKLCPVTRASKHFLGKDIVYGVSLGWEDDGLRYFIRLYDNGKIDLPIWVSETIKEYDSTGIMNPFEFEVEISGDNNHEVSDQSH